MHFLTTILAVLSLMECITWGRPYQIGDRIALDNGLVEVTETFNGFHFHTNEPVRCFYIEYVCRNCRQVGNHHKHGYDFYAFSLREISVMRIPRKYLSSLGQGRKRVMRPCKLCDQPYSAREMRKHIVECRASRKAPQPTIH